MIFFGHHQTGKITGYLRNRGKKIYWDDAVEQTVDGTNILKFKMPSRIPEANGVEERTRIYVPAEKAGWQEFITYDGITTRNYKDILATGSEVELNKLKIMSPGVFEGLQLEGLLAAGVDGLEWEVGNVVGSGIRKYTLEKPIGSYDFLKRIETLFDVELHFRIVMKGNVVIGRYIDAYEKVGNRDSGKEFTAGKDLIEIEKSVSTGDIVTALVCFGPDKEDGTRLGPVYVYDEDALKKWGLMTKTKQPQHLFAIYEPQSDDQDMTEERLLSLGRTQLNKLIASVTSYKLKVADISPQFPHETVYLGDQVRIKDPKFSPPLYADSRIIKVTRPIDYRNRSKALTKEYEIGEVVTYTESEVLKTFRLLQDRYSSKVIKSPIPPEGKPNIIWIQTETGLPFDVAHIWMGGEWVAITPTSADQIGAEPTIPTQPIPPDPNVYQKWVDNSGDIAILKMWNPTTGTWDAVQGPPGADGIDGEDGYTPVHGVDYFDGIDGQDGTDGTSAYIWVRYSQFADGTGLTDDPTDAKFIGTAVTNDAIAPASPSAYNWSLIKGEDGVPGEPGDDGRSSYLHIKYSNDGGTTFTANNGETVGDWIGTYIDFTQADSADPLAYTWNKVKGEKGDQGDEGPRGLQGIQGDDGEQGIPGTTGDDGLTSYTHIAYADTSAGGGFNQEPTNKEYIGIYVDFIELDSSDPTKYKWSLIKGAKGDEGTPGLPGDDGLTPYFHIAYATNSTGSAGFDTTIATGKTYIGTYTDYTANDSSDPTKYTWALIKGEKGDQGDEGPRGLQGIQGDDGEQGIPGEVGENGLTSYTHIAYADTSTGGGLNQEPAGKEYVGMYTDFTALDSADPTKYKWSLIKGAKGDEGTPGQPGDNGLTPYFHTAWANNSAGTSGFSTTSSAGKLYLGTYTDYTPADSINPALYTWTLIKGDKGDVGDKGDPGEKGEPGIEGPPGDDGSSQYVHIRYSANSSGAAMTTTPQSNTAYVGLVNTTSPTAPGYTSFTWSLFKGPEGDKGDTGGQGVPGPTGDDGQTTYTWVKYADDMSGSGLSDTPSGKRYIGLAFNKTTPTESNTASLYSWSPLFEAIVPVAGGKIYNNPVGANVYSSGSSTTGKLLISTPITPNKMVTMNISGYNYSNGKSVIDLTVTFYAYSSRPLNYSVVSKGDFPIGSVEIARATDNKYHIILGEWNTVWSYPAVQVDTVKISYQTPPDAWQEGWAMSFITSMPAFAESVVIPVNDIIPAITKAQTTADGKNTVFHQASAPSSAGRIEGDIWFNSSDGFKMHRFNGGWVVAQFGENAIVANSITANHIKSFFGLNVNDQFMVDANGNVTFAGNLSGASGTFSGSLSSGDGFNMITIDDGRVYNEEGRALFYMDSHLLDAHDQTPISSGYVKTYTHRQIISVAPKAYSTGNFIEVTLTVTDPYVVSISKVLALLIQAESKEWYAYENANGRVFNGDIMSTKIRISPHYGYTSGGTTIPVNLLIVGVR